MFVSYLLKFTGFVLFFCIFAQKAEISVSEAIAFAPQGRPFASQGRPLVYG